MEMGQFNLSDIDTVNAWVDEARRTYPRATATGSLPPTHIDAASLLPTTRTVMFMRHSSSGRLQTTEVGSLGTRLG
jgi:hypothetical protein